MRENREWVEIWLREKQHEMIHCPHQPGNLVISKAACFRRYRVEQTLREFKNQKFPSGYSLCGQCPIGGRLDRVSRTARPAVKNL